jgi:hypothetical protein
VTTHQTVNDFCSTAGFHNLPLLLETTAVALDCLDMGEMITSGWVGREAQAGSLQSVSNRIMIVTKQHPKRTSISTVVLFLFCAGETARTFKAKPRREYGAAAEKLMARKNVESA